MKKLITSLLLLLAGAAASTALADTYPLKVGGVTVTDDNKDQIKSSHIEGQVSYNPDTRTLTLKDATLTIEESINGIYNSGIDNLHIRLVGTVNINTSASHSTLAGIHCLKGTTIESGSPSTAKLNVNNTGSGPAIKSADGATIQLLGIYLTATADNNHAIYAKDPAQLNVLASTVIANAKNRPGTNNFAIMNFTKGLNLNYKGCPLTVFGIKGHSWDDATGSVVTKGASVAGTSLYPAVSIGDEPLSYMAPKLTPASTGASEVSGNATLNFNDSQLQLVLDNFNMKRAGITVRSPNTIIEVNGVCNVSSYFTNGLYIMGRTTISGPGSLKLSSEEQSGLATYNNADVTIELPQLEARGKSHGFFGEEGGRLTLMKCANNGTTSYRFSGDESDVYAGYLTLSKTDICNADTYWNHSDGFVYCKDKYAKSSSIADGTCFVDEGQVEYFDVSIAGTRVRKNCSEYIITPCITAGTVKYFTYSQTLMLNNATIETHNDSGNDVNDCAIYSGGDVVRIIAYGTNDIIARSNGILFNNSITIDGTQLNVTSEERAAIAPYGISNGTLTLGMESTGQPSCFMGKTYGFDGSNYPCRLAFKKGSRYGALYKFAGEFGNIIKVPEIIFANGFHFASPWTWHNEEDQSVYMKNDIAKAGNVAQGTWICGNERWTEYPITICGEPLYGTTINGVRMGNASGFYNKNTSYDDDDSDISYDPDSKTLTLRDVTIEQQKIADIYSAIGIENEADIRVNVEGKNCIRSAVATGIQIKDNAQAVIEGTGELDIEGMNIGYNTWGNNCVTTIQGDVTVKASGARLGIGGQNLQEYNGSLVVAGKATVEASTIAGFNTFTLLDEQKIVEPVGATVGMLYRNDFAIGESVFLGDELAENVVISSIQKGDVNTDGNIDIADAVSVLNAMAGEEVAGNPDVNGDNTVDIADFITVLNIMAGEYDK